MLRTIVLSTIFSFLLSGAASAQQAQIRIEKLFDKKTHDFGTVARGAKTLCSFNIKNIYQEDVHIARVRSSCGCTTPKIVNPTLKTNDVGKIVAQLDTNSFIGQKSATITVVIDKPYYAEVQLQVRGNIRHDVVVNPGAVQLGTIDQGKIAEQKISVNYEGGRSDWELLDIQSTNPHLEVKMNRAPNPGGGRVNYDLLVRLKDDAPAGYFQDQLILVTNDQGNQHIPVAVEGQILSAITLPQQFYLGTVEPQQQVRKQLVIHGKQPFKIMAVECDDPNFQFKFEANGKAKKLHLVMVTYSSDQVGNIERPISIRTDAQAEARTTARVNVVASQVTRTSQTGKLRP